MLCVRLRRRTSDPRHRCPDFAGQTIWNSPTRFEEVKRFGRYMEHDREARHLPLRLFELGDLPGIQVVYAVDVSD